MDATTESECVLRERIKDFVASKANLLAKLKGKGRLRRGIDYSVGGCCEAYSVFACQVPPVELGLKVSVADKKTQIFQILKVGDIIIGKVVAKRPFGIFVRILTLEHGRNLDFEETEIQAMCHKSELIEDHNLREHIDAIDDFEIDDLVRGVISLVSLEEERIAVSFRSMKVPAEYGNMELGIVEELGDALNKRETSFDENKDYNDYLENDLGFANPTNVETLVDVLGIGPKALTSFLQPSERCVSTNQDEAEGLRKCQSFKWSMDTTAQGVECFKTGNCVKAKKLFDHALKICEENAEALVARGALLANQNKLDDAIKDFRCALAINLKHSNANKYLKETLFAKGVRLKKVGNVEGAIEVFQDILCRDPKDMESREYLHELQTRILKSECSNEKRKAQIPPGKETDHVGHVRKLIELIETDPDVTRTERRKKRKKRKKSLKSSKTKKRVHSRSDSSTERTNSASEGGSNRSEEWVEISPKQRGESEDDVEHRKQTTDRSFESLSKLEEHSPIIVRTKTSADATTKRELTGPKSGRRNSSKSGSECRRKRTESTKGRGSKSRSRSRSRSRRRSKSTRSRESINRHRSRSSSGDTDRSRHRATTRSRDKSRRRSPSRGTRRGKRTTRSPRSRSRSGSEDSGRHQGGNRSKRMGRYPEASEKGIYRSRNM